MEGDTTKPRSTPAASSKLLSRHSNSKPFDNSFNYRSVIGKLNYLEKATRSNISYAVHQCALLSPTPRWSMVRPFAGWEGTSAELGTRAQSCAPYPRKSLRCMWTLAFVGIGARSKQSMIAIRRGRDTATLSTSYAGCPLLWKSQLQTEIALSSTESEYTGLSYALRDAIPIMQLLKEMKRHGFPIQAPQARAHCHKENKIKIN